MEETRVPGENHRPVTSHCKTLSHNLVSMSGIQIQNVNAIGTDCTGSYKSNYHNSMTMTAPGNV